MSLLTYQEAAAELAVSKRTVEEFVAARAVTRDREAPRHLSPVRASRGSSSFADEWAAAS